MRLAIIPSAKVRMGCDQFGISYLLKKERE